MAAAVLNNVLIGNTGVGKSTVLNGAVGEFHFESGVSLGGGLTTHMEVYTDPRTGINYVDTPGLRDSERPHQAAAEVTRALRLGGQYRVFFIIELRSGRLSQQDIEMMQLVLQAAPELTSFGIIFNKVRPAVRQRLQEDPHGPFFRELLEALPGQPRVNFHIMEEDAELKDVQNAVKRLPPDLERFMKALPEVTVDPDSVSDIGQDIFQHEREEARRLADVLVAENQDLLQALNMSAAGVAQLMLFRWKVASVVLPSGGY